VSMTTHFHASADELAAHGTAPLAAVADSHVFHRSFCDQSVELYGRDGQLLATSHQVAFFRFGAKDQFIPGNAACPMFRCCCRRKIYFLRWLNPELPFNARNGVDNIFKFGNDIQNSVRKIKLAEIPVGVGGQRCHQRRNVFGCAAG